MLDCIEHILSKPFRISAAVHSEKDVFPQDSNAAKKSLHRITVEEANQSGKQSRQVPAFLGWRFSHPTDVTEMEAVEKWLRKHKSNLKVSISEGKVIYFKFSLGTRVEKWLFVVTWTAYRDG